jgi:hypothetical protein
MRLIRAIVLAVIVSALLGSARVANATPDSASAAAFGGDTASEQIDPGDPGLPPDQ